MKYLVTGGAGFIGSNIVSYLVQNGEQVRVLDNLSTGKEANLASVKNEIEFVRGDIRDFDTVLKAASGIDRVLHLAALASVQQSINDPISSHEVNVVGTLNVLESSRRSGVKKVVSSSSSSVYGATLKLPIDEETEPAPMSPYAIGKLTGEYYVRMYWEMYKLPAVSLRSFNVYGPNQNPDGDYAAVIPKFILSLLSDEKPTIFGDGEQTRDFVFVEDAVRANILAATNDDMVGAEYNVASGQKYSLNELLDCLRELIGTDIEGLYANSRPGDIHHSCADITKLRSQGFKPQVELKDGLKQTIEYIKNHFPSPNLLSKMNR